MRLKQLVLGFVALASSCSITEVTVEDRKQLHAIYQELLSYDEPVFYASATKPIMCLDDLSYTQVYHIADSVFSTLCKVSCKTYTIGYSSSDEPINSYRLSKKNSYDFHKVIFLITGNHGNEKSAIYGGLMAIDYLTHSSDAWINDFWISYDVVYVPCLNPWGIDSFTRENENGIDLNRDFDSFTQNETYALRDLLKANEAQIHAVLDFHNTTLPKSYFVYSPLYKRASYYRDVANILSSWFTDKWSESFSNITTAPFFYTEEVEDTRGRLHYYVNNSLGAYSHTIEVPGNLDKNKNQLNCYTDASLVVQEICLNELYIITHLVY